MSGVYSDEYEKYKYHKPVFACSGSFLGTEISGFSMNYMYEGLGITYPEKVKCEFCDSIYYVSKENTRCPSCGASYQKKQMF